MSAAFFLSVWLCGVYVGVVLSNEILTPPSSKGIKVCLKLQYLCGSIHSIGNLKLNRHRKHHSRESVSFSD